LLNTIVNIKKGAWTIKGIPSLLGINFMQNCFAVK
jgi:hypothetical protein